MKAFSSRGTQGIIWVFRPSPRFNGNVECASFWKRLVDCSSPLAGSRYPAGHDLSAVTIDQDYADGCCGGSGKWQLICLLPISAVGLRSVHLNPLTAAISSPYRFRPPVPSAPCVWYPAWCKPKRTGELNPAQANCAQTPLAIWQSRGIFTVTPSRWADWHAGYGFVTGLQFNPTALCVHRIARLPNLFGRGNQRPGDEYGGHAQIECEAASLWWSTISFAVFALPLGAYVTGDG
jgi:hypothetical protein